MIVLETFKRDHDNWLIVLSFSMEITPIIISPNEFDDMVLRVPRLPVATGVNAMTYFFLGLLPNFIHALN